MRSRFDIHLRPPRFVSWRPRRVATRTSRSSSARSLAERDLPLGPGEPLPVPAPCVRSSASDSPISRRDARRSPWPHRRLRGRRSRSSASLSSIRGPSAALAAAVDAGLLEFDGDRVRFAHPLIASVVYADAMHRRAARTPRPYGRGRGGAGGAGAPPRACRERPDADVAASLDEAAARFAPAARRATRRSCTRRPDA